MAATDHYVSPKRQAFHHKDVRLAAGAGGGLEVTTCLSVRVRKLRMSRLARSMCACSTGSLLVLRPRKRSSLSRCHSAVLRASIVDCGSCASSINAQAMRGTILRIFSLCFLAYLFAVPVGAQRTIEFETSQATQADVALSPDGKWLIFAALVLSLLPGCCGLQALVITSRPRKLILP